MNDEEKREMIRQALIHRKDKEKVMNNGRITYHNLIAAVRKLNKSKSADGPLCACPSA